MSDAVQGCACVSSFTLCDNSVKSISHRLTDPFTCQKMKCLNLLSGTVLVTGGTGKMEMEMVPAMALVEASQGKGQLQYIPWVK